MASRIFQLGIVFAIGFNFGPALFVRAINITEIPLSIQLKNPYDVIVRKGQSATLRCDVKSSTAELHITWLHNDNPIPVNDSRRIVQKDGSLFITKVINGRKMNGLTGEYRCKAQNNIGTLISNPAKLSIASFDREFNRQPTNQNVPQFQPVVLFCNIHSIPTAQIRWEYNNTLPLPHSTRYVPLPNGALLITKTLSSDEGLYRCIATNSILKKTKYSKIVKLTVESNMMNTVAPTFLPLGILPNKTVLIGDNVTLYCAVTGWPIPSIQWLNNKNNVISNSSVLELKNVTINDLGNYACTANNIGGRIKHNYFVDIQQKPYFNVTPISLSFPLAITVRLNCQSKGIPEPKIYWLKNGSPLPMESRIKKQTTGLVFSHTFTTDPGIYQCFAVNAAGTSWVAAQIVLTYTYSLSPPENVRCRSYDDTSICLTWRPPPNISVQAYSIYSFYPALGLEIPGPEYVTNMTHQQATGLNGSTNYTFYVRLYSNMASDQSKEVTCETVIKGKRNLQITELNETSVELKWSNISTDVPCGGTKAIYKVQWKREGYSSVNINTSKEMKYIISGLSPSKRYEFRVTSMNYSYENPPWMSFILYGNYESTKKNDFHYHGINNTTEIVPVIPEHLEANPISSTSINITWWDFSADTKFYTLCYKDIKEEKNCEDSKQIKSLSNYIQIDKLQPNTAYEFKVRAHSSDTYFSPYSNAIEVETPAEVPSPVLDLRYKIVNETTVCLRWQAPLYKNGNLIKYAISYAPDCNWPLEKWISTTVPASQRKFKACWLGNEETVSILLFDLKSDQQYTVLVRAESDIGLGQPTTPIVVTTNDKAILNVNAESSDTDNTMEYNQKLGIILGVAIAIVSIIFCVSCILVRKECMKRRAMVRTRMAASNNYYPAVAHYASQGSSVQIRLEDPCSAEIHEVQHLFSEDQPHIPSITLTHLDTKGSKNFPNGHINGSTKPYMNGQVTNENVHITENPQYFVFESNGDVSKEGKNAGNYYSEFEEDSNSNIKTSNFQDLHKMFEDAKQMKSSTNKKHTPPKYQDNYYVNSVNKSNDNDNNLSDKDIENTSINSFENDNLLNSTQITCLNNSLIILPENNHKKISPVIGPNG